VSAQPGSPAAVWRDVANEAADTANYWRTRERALALEWADAREKARESEKRYERFSALADDWERGRSEECEQGHTAHPVS